MPGQFNQSLPGPRPAELLRVNFPHMGDGTRGFVREALEATNLLSGLDDGSLDRLCDSASPIELRGGGYLFHQGDEGDALYVVAGGRLEAIVEDHDPPVVVRACRRGDVFGELSMVCATPRSASMRAVRDSRLWRIEREDVETLLRDNADFAVALTRFLGDKVRASPAPLVPAGARHPGVIAVLAVGAVDAELVAAAVVRALGDSTVVVRGGTDGGSWAARVDAAESEGQGVVLAVTARDGDEWRQFATREADRVVAVADAGSSVAVAAVPPGCDLVLVGRSDRRRLRAWLEAVEPRAHHLVPSAGDHDALSRAARRITGTSVGLVLSGGGARGLAHLGVIEALADAGVVVDRVGGTSMGAFVAALLAQRIGVDEMTRMCRTELVTGRPFNDYTAPRVALLRGRKARAMLRRVCGDVNIEELPLDYFAVSADLVSAEVVVHRRGLCVAAVAASMSLPGLAPPIWQAGRLLVDGGVLQNLPVAAMVERDEGPVLAVDVTAGGGVGTPESMPSIIETLTRSTMLGSRRATVDSRSQAQVVFRPRVDDVGLMEFSRIDTLIARGREAVERRAGSLDIATSR